MHFVYLAVAIIAEVTATSALKATEGFTRLLPSIVVIAGYGLAFYFLSLTLRTMAIGVVYAIWSGVGTALICVVAAVLYKQTLDVAALIGIALIVSGVLVLNLSARAIAQ